MASELPPGCHPTKWTFPHRNRLLAALGDAVLVVEGAETSGALQTAKWALELGRTVYCVPGSIFSQASEGCNALISEGARSALRPDVIAEDFLWATRMERGARSATDPPRAAAGEQMRLPGVAQDSPGSRVLEALRVGPRSADALARSAGLSVREVSAALGELEVRGEVSRAGPGVFLRVRARLALDTSMRGRTMRSGAEESSPGVSAEIDQAVAGFLTGLVASDYSPRSVKAASADLRQFVGASRTGWGADGECDREGGGGRVRD